MSNLRDQGLNVFREMLPGVLPDDLPNDKVSFGSGFAPDAEAEMESHFRIARQNGLTEDELAEVIYHSTGYAGFPAANTAKTVAVQALRADREI